MSALRLARVRVARAVDDFARATVAFAAEGFASIELAEAVGTATVELAVARGLLEEIRRGPFRTDSHKGITR